MKRTFLAIWLALSFGLTAAIPAAAKTPPEVLKPYKAYRAALKVGKKEDAANLAYEAWQIAENLMGNSKTTGDLAFNYADLEEVFLDGKRSHDELRDAYERSIELASLAEEYGAEIELQRRIDFLAWAIPHVKDVKPAKDYSLMRLEERTISQGLKIQHITQTIYLCVRRVHILNAIGKKRENTLKTP